MRLTRGLMALTAAIWLVSAGLAIGRAQIAPPPAATSIRLVDTQGRPVQGAVVSTAFQREAELQSRFVPSGFVVGTSDARGELKLVLDARRDIQRTGLYAIRPGDRALVGIHKPTREQLRIGKPIAIVMHPACRVRLRVECPGHLEVERQYHVEPRGDRWRRFATVVIGDDVRDLHVLSLRSMTGELEFLLPPGRFLIRAGGDEAAVAEVRVAVGPGHRVRSLGVIDVPPDEAVRRGLFIDYHHLSRADRRGAGAADDLRLRPVRWGPALRADPFLVHDLAYSPDGRTLATAHWNNVAPGGVNLWDGLTGELAAHLPAPVSAGGVRAIAFAPDGRWLAGVVGEFAAPLPPWAVILWDVAARREVGALRVPGPPITTIAFAPDGRTLASGGDDAIVRLWDVASGREAGRIEAGLDPIQSIAYSPDGKTLAIVARFALRLWDVPGRRFGATLEKGDFWVNSVAFAPDGRTLAAAGVTEGANRRKSEARVRLYDMAGDPPACRAELDSRIDGPEFANPVRANSPFSAVAFTRDGRRVVAMHPGAIAVWDAGSGARQDFIRRISGPSDRLAVAPDGRWLAVTQGHDAQVIDLVPPGP